MPVAALETEIGWVEVTADGDAITHLFWRGTKPARLAASPLVKEAQKQLRAYFAGKLRDFDLPIKADGTDFARAVWREMLAIPYGATLTYGDVAAKLGVEGHEMDPRLIDPRAVGQACGQNPIAVIIPCHRITGTNWLGGYSSELGTNAKEYLLDLEKGQGRLF